MDLHHTKTAECNQDPLRKMRIPFLTINQQDILEIERHVDINPNKHCVNAGVHQYHTSRVAAGNSLSWDQSVRVERRVACQSSILSTNSDSGYAAYSKEDVLRDQGQWPWGQPAEHLDTIRPLRRTALLGQGGFDDYTSLPDTSEQSRLKDPTSLSSGPFRSPRLAYTDEEKLFVVCSHVTGLVNWHDVSRIFKIVFGTEGDKHMIPSLMKIYKRTRRDWKMDCGTRRVTGPRRSDEMIVRANLSKNASRSYSA